MTKLGADWSYSPPNLTQLRQAGYGFTCRYLSHSGKGITAAEAAQTHSLSMDIHLIYENTANRALSGSGGGAADGATAKALAVELGQAAGSAIYFAVDFDATAAQMPTVLAYLDAASKASAPYAGGGYGSYAVVTAALAGKHVKYGWSTYAWSGGKKAGHLHQYLNGQKIAGGVIDLNEALAADTGAWTPPIPTPPAAPQKEGTMTTTPSIVTNPPVVVFLVDYQNAVWAVDCGLQFRVGFRSAADLREAQAAWNAAGVIVKYPKLSASQMAGIPVAKG